MLRMASSKSKTVIYLLRNDLRVHDNECLRWAQRNSDYIVPLYCFEPHHYKGTYHFNFPKTGIHRAKFNVEAIHDLRSNMKKLGSDLVVRHSSITDAVSEVIRLCSDFAPVESLVYQQEVTQEETDQEKKLSKVCEEHNVTLQSFWGLTLFHLEDIPYNKGNIPDTYTQFRKGVEGGSKVRPVLNMPAKLNSLPAVADLNVGDIPKLTELGYKEDSPEVDSRSAAPFSGGETAGLQRLDNYLWGTDAIATYKETRNGLVGEDYSTKFSPWLANGCLSPRQIYQEVKRYENERVSNQSTYWCIFELIWRDYFKYVCLRYGNSVFELEGIMGKQIPWKNDMDLFNKWSQGETGVPFVDANMRELLHTGWMSNRGRQNVASFLVKDLNIDWRMGAEWFESMLLDHDVCSNYGNWNYAAGIGNDPRENRKFNMIKQGLDYDAKGEFVKLWLPELKNIPDGKVHMPWTIPDGDLQRFNITLGMDYPQPVMIAPEWNRHKHKAEGKGNNQQQKNQQRGVDFYFKSDNKKT